MALEQYKTFSLAKVGESFTRPVLIRELSVIKKDDKSKPYVRFTLLDGESEASAIMFDTDEKKLDTLGIKKNMIANANFKVGSFNGKSFNIEEISPYSGSDVSIGDFVITPPIDVNVMYDEIIDTLKACADDMGGSARPLTDIAVSILEDSKAKYLHSSAAVKVHHNFLGGLIYHSYRMFKAADALCGVYDELDRELLLCAAAIHDVGKIWEYNTDAYGNAEYTENGVLFGHIYLGANLVNKYADRLGAQDGKKFNDEKVKLLAHMILSHHGTLEWGAVVPPAVPEAFVLHYIDNLDAKLNVCDKEYKKMKAGDVTQSKPFTFDGRIYKPKYKEN